MKIILIEIFRILKLFYYIILNKVFKNKTLLVKAAVKTNIHGVKKFNWGDDLNYYLLSLISKKKILFLPHGEVVDSLNIRSFLGIGSIISFYNLNNTTIIGSGLINKQSILDIKGKPKNICFVRGPLTRQVLINNNIACPEIYGDLALTLPLFYTPSKNKKHRIGIVLHILDKNICSVKHILKKYPEILVIYMNEYKKWTDIIDAINSCEIIFSSALHGLITSEAYHVCCQWISFDDRNKQHWNPGYEFKYWDFYESVGKINMSPIILNKDSNLYEIAEKVENMWKPISYNPQILIDALPKEFYSFKKQN